VLDHPIALKFYDLRVCIFNQLLKKASEPEEQIRLLNEWFQTEAIREEIRRYICLVFLDQTFCQDENYARLKKISEGLADQEKMLKAYQNKRFATVGAPCPDVQFEDLKGQVHHLSEFKGKYVYLNLWASWCKSCSEEFSYLKKLAKELKNSPIVFVSISVDSDRDVWLKKVKELGLSGNQWIVTDKNFLKMLGVKEVPHSLLYSKEGTLLQYKAPRPSSEEALKKILFHLK
jgi:thiol-disulfide isomerase/thioredoxin